MNRSLQARNLVLSFVIGLLLSSIARAESMLVGNTLQAKWSNERNFCFRWGCSKEWDKDGGTFHLYFGKDGNAYSFYEKEGGADAPIGKFDKSGRGVFVSGNRLEIRHKTSVDDFSYVIQFSALHAV